ncbi:hypothetical protein [Sporomusa acidovorans]|uniref:Uncharacterized protein n=1 Tax=Sporomusa acidovorans (strain ATCC 49682 / DSM 3132 / Mol) TaxID=1123286 RepID=A0ABZ3IXP7_SPOA4|nr:hypothetical protein [Sporomusa acidovorans]OZC22374.1 hypothetical protein SPACI_14230 [Sporomusa acidovorans DSM 3132]SDE47312.1 hypothetical protein SAMN04488499_101447 [Sporomusa acidovorans]
MNCHNESCTCICVEELEKKSRRLANSTKTTITAGNSVVLFTMLLLEEILEQLSLNPVANLNSILAIASSIATLNNSITIDP